MDDRQRAIVDRTYARDITRKETWAEIVTRVTRGNCAKDPDITDNEIDMLKWHINTHRILPGGRHMWSVGAPGREFIDNCFATGWSKGFVEHYRFLFMRLMEGGGVGSDYSNDVIGPHAPVVHNIVANIKIEGRHQDYEKCKPYITNNTYLSVTYHIYDSREGWARALVILLELMCHGESKTLRNETGENGRFAVTFDFSHIRAEGKPLHGSGGTASGPAALMAMFSAIIALSEHYYERKANSKLCIMISHEIAKAVMAGNTRRSAQIGLKDWQDHDIDEFIALKWEHEIYTMNLSVKAYGAFWQSTLLHDIAVSCRENGEPGLANLDLIRVNCPDFFSLNPCGELPLPEFGSCCLGSVNLAACKSEDDIKSTFRLLARFLVRGTLFPCQDPKTQAVRDEHRIIGCGITGLADWCSLYGVEYGSKTMEDLAYTWRKIVVESANEYCDRLGINRPRAYTTCAPTGTMSKVAGCSEGIQPHLYDYFVNRVIYKADHPKLGELGRLGFKTEDSVNARGSKVVSFPMRAGVLKHVQSIETAATIGVERQLEMQRIMQQHYADNSVSFTVNFDPAGYSADQIEALLRKYGPLLKGTTLMPFVGDKYQQLPQEQITKEEYEQMVANIGSHAHGVAGECKGGVCNARPFAD